MVEDGVTVCMQDPLDDCLEEFLPSSTMTWLLTLPPVGGGAAAAVCLWLLGCLGPRLLLAPASSACCAITGDLLGARWGILGTGTGVMRLGICGVGRAFPAVEVGAAFVLRCT